MEKLLLFGTLGCHLCEEAELVIEACDLKKIEITQVDIAEHEQWQEKYAIRIPVLYHQQTKEELGWPFTELDVQALINKLSND